MSEIAGTALRGKGSGLRQRGTTTTTVTTDGTQHKPLNDSASSLRSEDFIPRAKWAFQRDGFPQAIAHRGYKAEYPENTMGAFRGAVDVGAHAIETDVHLSKDNVVVIAHVRDCLSASLSLSYIYTHSHLPFPTLHFLTKPTLSSRFKSI